MKIFPRPTRNNVPDATSGEPELPLLMLKLDSNPTLFSVVRGTVERLTETLGFPSADCRSITRAVDEALTNIVRHSYGNRPHQSITVYFRRTGQGPATELRDGLEILLCDRGIAVDPVKLRGRPLDEIRPGGLGLHFIHQAMDVVEFIRKGHTNRLRLVKYLAHTNGTP